jgi:hypothetical protein
MSSPPWKLLGALVLAAPVVLFLVLLAFSPPTAGTFAGSLLGRLTDPLVLLGVVLAGVAGALRFQWFWAFGVGIAVGIAGCVIGYSWWAKVVGETAAGQIAAQFIIWTIFLTLYGFIAGRMFLPTPKNTP